MKVICIEGCHGCGKTELIKHLARAGFNVLDEGFLNMPQFALPPQSFVMESIWVMRWVERILRIHKEEPGAKDAIYFADRSPFSALFYARNGGLMETTIKEQLKDLLEFANIQIITVYVRVEEELLWKRICERLKQEPERRKYNEDKYDWMQRTVQFYEDKSSLWDYTVHNNDLGVQRLMQSLMAIVQATNDGHTVAKERDESSKLAKVAAEPPAPLTMKTTGVAGAARISLI